MPDDAAESPYAPCKPDWLPDGTCSAMEQALYRAMAFGRDSQRVTQAVRDVAFAHMPAAPMCMIAEAVACIVPDPQGPATLAPEHRSEPLRLAKPEEVSETLSYALRYDECGKPRRTGQEFTTGLAAAQLVRQMELSGFVVMKRPPLKPHKSF